METKNIIFELRTQKGLSQDELAEKVYVTRQAVSRWETGETVPNTETLKLLSKLFDVSINTLLGAPRKLICQCCGMPLDDSSISKEPDGAFNEEYCKWCYADGNFCYTSLEELTDFLVAHMSNENWPAEAARAYFDEHLPKLNYWKKYVELGGDEKFSEVKCIVEGEQIKLGFPQYTYKDNYPHCDGEHDRWTKTISGFDYLCYDFKNNRLVK